MLWLFKAFIFSSGRNGSGSIFGEIYSILGFLGRIDRWAFEVSLIYKFWGDIEIVVYRDLEVKIDHVVEGINYSNNNNVMVSMEGINYSDFSNPLLPPHPLLIPTLLMYFNKYSVQLRLFDKYSSKIELTEGHV